MKVFLHIGAPRTGTTSLQSLLTMNRARLVAAGLDYPALGLLHPSKGVAQHKLSFSLLPVWPAFAIQAKCSWADAWGELRKYMLGAAKPLFLSSEAFSSLDERGVGYVAEFFAGHDVTAIYVRRDPLEWRRSMHAHRIVVGQETAAMPPWDAPAEDLSGRTIETWSRRLPVKVIDYSPTCHADVLALAGVDHALLTPVELENRRVPDYVLELLRRLNSIPMEELHRIRFNKTIIDYLERKPV